MGIAGIGREEGGFVFAGALAGGVAVALFGQHHTALALHRLGGKAQLARGLAHQHQRGIEQPRVGARQVQHIGGVLVGGEGVGVGAKGQAQPLQQAHHLARLHMGGALKRHVLDEMGIATLIIGLVERAGGNLHADLHHTLRRGVRHDDIAHAIGQGAAMASRSARFQSVLAQSFLAGQTNMKHAGALA